MTALSAAELQAILADSVIYSFNEELPVLKQYGIEETNPLANRRVREILEAEYRKTAGTLHNLTRTSIGQANSDLIKLLDEADIKTASGVQSYDEAIRDALREYAGQGMVITYPSGAKRSIESVIRSCVVTGMNQTSAQITNFYIQEAGVEYVLTSAHIGARVATEGQPGCADHMSWQGQVFKIRGSEPGIPNLAERTGYDIKADGTGEVLDPLGLHGYNCRHSHKPWIPTMKNPYRNEAGQLIDGNKNVITKEANETRYKLNQKQRAMERQIRKTERIYSMTQAEEIKQKLYAQRKTYNQFCRDNKLPPRFFH